MITLLYIFFGIVIILMVNMMVAACIHALRDTQSKQSCVSSVLILLCAPYMIYLIVTKQGHVIDEIAKEKKDRLKEYLKAYKKE